MCKTLLLSLDLWSNGDGNCVRHTVQHPRGMITLLSSRHRLLPTVEWWSRNEKCNKHKMEPRWWRTESQQNAVTCSVQWRTQRRPTAMARLDASRPRQPAPAGAYLLRLLVAVRAGSGPRHATTCQLRWKRIHQRTIRAGGGRNVSSAIQQQVCRPHSSTKEPNI